jgi:hypothetical protein
MEKTNNVAPMATLPHGMKECKSELNDAGSSKIPCARRDNTPAALMRVFLKEKDMIFKSIAQKRFFFY